MSPEGLQNMQRWKPVDAPRTNGPDLRSPQALKAVVKQFYVETNPRYAPERGPKNELVTFCNIFAWDVMRALGVVLPHWVDAAGEPTKPGPPSEELSCNKLLPWLEEHGARHGWREVDEATAALHANNGRPAIAIWKNRSGPGHIAVLLPSSDTTTRIAQAGARCFFDGPLKDFGVAVKHLRFFVHP